MNSAQTTYCHVALVNIVEATDDGTLLNELPVGANALKEQVNKGKYKSRVDAFNKKKS